MDYHDNSPGGAIVLSFTCKSGLTLAGKLVNAISTPGVIATRIAGTLV